MTAADRRTVRAICLGLVAVNLIVYAPLRHYGFVNYNDPTYVYENPFVTRGLTWRGALWALTTVRDGSWFPLTWMSHMLDVQLYGANAGAHHLTNVALHIASAVLLFIVLRRMTGAIGPSALVAALFSLHPLQVESVAWIADRKNVLSTLLWILTLGAYVRYVRRPAFRRYMLVLVLYALGLMTLPVLVALPFTLLLLDVWPLGRVPMLADGDSPQDAAPSKDRAALARDLLWEKVPLFSLAVTSGIVTLAAHRRGGVGLDAVPFTHRLGNAVISYVAYVGKMLWPRRLGVFYGYPESPFAWKVLAAILVLGAISIVVSRQRQRQPYLTVGWLWYLVTLAPVIGMVQVGNHAMADRYVYVPLIGLSIAVAWAARDLVMRRQELRTAVVAAAFAVISAFAIVARHQIAYWESSLLLWQHARDVNAVSHTVETNLAQAYAGEGKLDDAIAHFTEAVRLTPDAPEIHYALATVLARRGKLDEAVRHYSEALRIRPDYADAHATLALVLTRQGKFDDAVLQHLEALRIRPDPREHYNLALLLQRQARIAEAEKHLEAALRLDPNYAAARQALDRLRPKSAAGGSKPPRSDDR